jgi:LuxR family transcriptional regulator, quorum-sensing system regulator CciR
MSDALESPSTGSEGPANARALIVQEFARASRGARDLDRLREVFRQAVRALGFNYFLLQGETGNAWLADVPLGWTMAAAPFGDAVLTTAVQSYAPFLWSDIPRLIALTPEQRAFLDAAFATGVGAAVAVPIHRARGADAAGSYSDFAGCCSFMMKTGIPLPLGSLAAAHFVGALAFDAADNLRQARSGRSKRGPQLTPRQRDCVVLVARGKSDWEIGQLLGISESTAHKHVEDAKRRFRVTTRIQLVVRSLFDARLSFSDTMKESDEP